MEEERKWEELNRDCLVEIFARVGTKSLLQCIPFVCKSWYPASLVPKCWETLVFPYPFMSNDFVKSVVDRSQGTATHIEFQRRSFVSKEVLVYISEKCPALKTLYMCNSPMCALTGDLVCEWKKLEFLHIFRIINLKPILESISIHCKNFVGLDCSNSLVDEATSAAIVEFIPNIKHLKMRFSKLRKEYLVEILEGCRSLESLDVSYCYGFDDNDTLILELASHIPSFICNGSSFIELGDNISDEDYDRFNYFDLDYYDYYGYVMQRRVWERMVTRDSQPSFKSLRVPKNNTDR